MAATENASYFRGAMQNIKTAKQQNWATLERNGKPKKKERRKLSHYSRRNIVLVNAEKKNEYRAAQILENPFIT